MSKAESKLKRKMAALEAAKNTYEFAARVLREHKADQRPDPVVVEVPVKSKATKRGRKHRKHRQVVRYGGPFLQSYEWRKLRMEAIKLHGGKCQCCGASPVTGAVLNVDHIKPRKFFPELALTLSNLQVLCHECNHGKGNWDMTDWREKVEA